MPPGICYGRSDVALVDGWQAAMPALADRLQRHGVRRILCSPAARCRLPAEVLGQALAITVEPDPALLELDFGAWEGLAWDDVPRRELDRWAGDLSGFTPPDGESGRSLIERVRTVWTTLGSCADPCLVVSHGGPLRVLAQMLRGCPVDLLHPPPPIGALVFVMTEA